MKELSIEDKANRYDKAIEIAKSKIKNDKDHVLYEDDVMEIFPELSESDDERIRKQIISFLKEFEYDHYRSLDFSSWIAWLEKQGEQKPYSQMEKCINCQFNMAGYCNGTCILKNKVEPKFKVGDWISNGQYTRLVIGISFDWGDYYYMFEDGTSKRIEHIDEKYHLWAINDAKDGDVLRLGDVIAIFKKYIGQEKCICYCSFCDNCYCSSCNNVGFEIPIENGEDNVYGCTNTTPATREERDLLFQKMKEAGYEWNEDKKELIKL